MKLILSLKNGERLYLPPVERERGSTHKRVKYDLLSISYIFYFHSEQQYQQNRPYLTQVTIFSISPRLPPFYPLRGKYDF